jgi:hypothetical protein
MNVRKGPVVVFFSRTGYTRRVAEDIARRLQASLLPITEEKSRQGLMGYSKCLIEASWRLLPKIQLPPFDPSDCSLVVIGTPLRTPETHRTLFSLDDPHLVL